MANVAGLRTAVNLDALGREKVNKSAKCQTRPVEMALHNQPISAIGTIGDLAVQASN